MAGLTLKLRALILILDGVSIVSSLYRLDYILKYFNFINLLSDAKPDTILLTSILRKSNFVFT